MKKNIIKKIFIKISKILGFELIDQNEFESPTLEKEINKNLSNENKSIIMPLGVVDLTRKVESLLILFRTNSNIEIWDQNKKRIFEDSKIEYALRSLNSLIKSIKNLKENYNSIKVDIKVVDDNVTTWINGKKMITLTDEKIGNANGSIALQIHDGGGIKVRWKDIMIREIL